MSAIGDRRASADSGADQSADAGTTLIEALVVVALTALVGAVTFPVVGQALAGATFREAVGGLQADLRIARAQAMRTSAPVALSVDADGRGYGWTPGPQRALLAGITLAPARGAVLFYPDGSSAGGALRLTSGHAVVDLRVDPDLGVVQAPPP